MRNILIVLTLFALTLTTSNVFANVYDESKRTERLGLSFYDGRPLYVVMFALTYDGSGKSNGFGMAYYRMYTGDRLDDFGQADFTSYNGQGRSAVVRYGNLQVHERYFYSVIDSEGMVVYTGHPAYVYPYTDWTRELLKQYPPPKYTSGDLAVKTYDRILPNAQDWARRGILLAVALLVISTGLNKFRELTSGEAQTTVKEEKKVDATSSQEERATVRKIREAAKLGKLGGGLDERFLSESERREHDFITGKAFGLEFDDKVRASNKLFLDAFNRLPRYEQEALLQEWRVSSYTESYQGSVERRFIDWREGSGNDGATSRKQTDAFDNWFGSSDPFNDNDEEDGEPPF